MTHGNLSTLVGSIRKDTLIFESRSHLSRGLVDSRILNNHNSSLLKMVDIRRVSFPESRYSVMFGWSLW